MIYFLGIDIGTSSVKAVLINEAGKIISTKQEPYPIIEPQPGYREQDAVVVKAATFKVIKKITSESGDPSKIKSICFSAAMHSLLAVDKNNQPLIPALLWADARSNDEAKTLKKNGTASEIYKACGTPVHPMLPLTKLLWLKKNKSELFIKATKFVSIKEYICYELIGQWLVDFSIASATGMFDIHELKWNEKAVQLAGINSHQLSKPVSTSWHINEWKQTIKAELGLPEDIHFVIGSSDGCMANFGSNVILNEDMAISIGTSAAVRITSEQAVMDEQESIFNYVLDDNYFISGGASNNGAILLEWLNKEFFNLDNVTALIDEAFTVVPGCDGLIILPYLLGERAPVWDANAKGMVYGLQFHHTRKHFTRAIIEGIVMNIYLIAQKIIQHQPQIKRIIASGGFVKSPGWLQLIADVFNLPVTYHSLADASSYGAATWGGKSLELLTMSKISTFSNYENVIQPQKKNHDIYMSNFLVFKQLYQAGKNLNQ